jgi:peptidoglycan hydrolase CwlO-like protein
MTMRFKKSPRTSRFALIVACTLFTVMTISLANTEVLAAEPAAETSGASKQTQTHKQTPVAKIETPVAKIQEPVAKIQEPVAKTKEPVAKIEEPVANTKEPADRAKERDKNKDIFRPSEEISEDFAVSFPVDI